MVSEIERLAEDLERDERLVEELANLGGTSEELATWLAARGYDVGVEELAEILSASGGGLSDEELEGVSGGAGEMMSFNLQNMMGRSTKTISMLSNILKKYSSAQDGIIDNIK